jgi:hypothetical protein
LSTRLSAFLRPSIRPVGSSHLPPRHRGPERKATHDGRAFCCLAASPRALPAALPPPPITSLAFASHPGPGDHGARHSGPLADTLTHRRRGVRTARIVFFFRDPAGARRRLRACACGWLKWKARYRARAEHKPTWCSLSCAAVRWCRAVPPGRYRRPGRCRRLVTHHVPSSVPGVVVYGVLLLPVQIHRGLCRCRERIMQVQPCTEFVRFACALIITARHFVNPWLYQNA